MEALALPVGIVSVLDSRVGSKLPPHVKAFDIGIQAGMSDN
jgi:hypothetical protein